jgi:O-antigen/teichoic acid export membrane protein
LAVLVPTFLSLIFNGGVGVSSAHHVGSGKHTIAQVTSTAVTVAGVSTIAVVLILSLGEITGVLRALLPGLPMSLLWLGALLFPILLLRDALSLTLLGLGRVRSMAIADLTQYLVFQVLLVLALIIFRGSVIAAFVSYIVGILASLCVAAYSLKKHGLILLPSLDRALIGSVITLGITVSFALTIQYFTYRLDSFILNATHGAADVGIYTVAIRLTELLWIIPGAAGTAIFSLSTRDVGGSSVTASRAFWLGLWVSAIGGILLVGLGPWVIRIAFAAPYSGAYVPMLLLLPGSVFLGATSVLANDLAGRGLARVVLFPAIVGLITAVTLDIVLIPKYAIDGAAIASTFAYAIYAVLAISAYRRALNMPLGTFARAILFWRGQAGRP